MEAKKNLRNFKHGHTSGGRNGVSLKRSPEYVVWAGIKQRCNDPNSLSYARYGAKGIRVCDRWLKSFANFFADMGPRPKGMTLDRIDGKKGYSPDNCRWASHEQQQSNRVDTRFLMIDGEKICFKHAAKKYAIPETTLARRLKNGWELQKALTTPPQPRW